jgi:Methyltransferase domain
MKFIKQFLIKKMPSALLVYLQKNRMESKYRDLPIKEVFTKIYQEGAWGKGENSNQKYFSGSGSHQENITYPYIAAVRKVLAAYPQKPNVVDLGCGDFQVGSQLRDLCAGYTACDIVDPLIAYNKEKYRDLDVKFKVLDLTSVIPPNGEIVFIRQVFQHLSNEQISRALTNIVGKYKYLIISEHLPNETKFVHNLDKPAGSNTRLSVNSGVVITSPPFSFSPLESQCLCEVPEEFGIVKTYLYRLY